MAFLLDTHTFLWFAEGGLLLPDPVKRTILDPEKTCFMRDAESHDPTGEEKEFCKRCKSFLIEKGWKL